MTKKVVAVVPGTPLLDAAKILAEHNFDGVPVVDEQNVLVGILTEYDLVSKGSLIHLPTMQKILQNLSVMRKDRSQFRKEAEAITSLTVGDVMNSDPLTLAPTAAIEEVITLFSEHHRVNPVPVIDANRKVVGIVSRYDLIRLLRVAGGEDLPEFLSVE